MSNLTTLKQGESRIGRRKSLADWQHTPEDNVRIAIAADA